MLSKNFIPKALGAQIGSGVQVIWSQALMLTFILGICKLDGGPGVLLGLVFWALKGHRQAIQALTLTFVVLFLNPVLVPALPIYLMLRWLVIFAAIFRIYIDAMYNRITFNTPLLLLLAYSGIALLLAALVSPMLAVSLLKLSTFALVVGAVLLAAKLNAGESDYWASWFLTLVLVILCLSVPTYFVSSIGRAKNGRGFQGIINHPQALGIMISPVVAWLSGAYLTRENRSRPVKLLLLLGWASVFMSLARTSIIAIILGFMFSIITMALFKRRTFQATVAQIFHSKAAVASFAMSASAVLVVIVLSWSGIQQEMSEFISKGNKDSTSLTEGVQKSRGRLFEKSLANFVSNPITGIGFGVPSDTSAVIYNPSNSLASAPVEKGFVVFASLEETGIIGTTLLFFFIVALTALVLSNNSFPLLWLFFTCLMVNIGEMVFFAVGGIGMYLWLLIGLACIRPKRQVQEVDKRARPRYPAGFQDRRPYRRP